VPDLNVSVVSQEVRRAERAGDFPVGSKVFRVHGACTEGRPGGWSEGDAI
jgi:hypothetical protein